MEVVGVKPFKKLAAIRLFPTLTFSWWLDGKWNVKVSENAEQSEVESVKISQDA